ncbi:MAG: YcnI family protein [Bauldia sp.]
MRKIILLGGAAALLASAAQAHVHVVPAEAGPGATFTLGFTFGHGCEGAPTTALRVQMPAGIVSVQPFVKAGWQIEAVTGAYAAPQTLNGAEIAEGVVEVRWTGGEVPDALYDEFYVRARIADNVEPGTTLWFPVIQECPGGATSRWITVPVEGQPEPDEPTPGLLVTEPATGGGH